MGRWIVGALLVLSMGSSFCASAEVVERPKRPLVLAYYYTWYSTAFGPHGEWRMWMRKAPCTLYPEGTNADEIRFSPAIRNIASCAYPLIGPYDSDNAEVARWHVRLAKAAGIDAFLVDVWGSANPLCEKALMEVLLPIAEEEDFKVVIFDEAPQFVADQAANAVWARDTLQRCMQSPAYLRVDGKPVYCMYQVWQGRLKPEEWGPFQRTVEAGVGEVYWLIDRLVARSGGDRAHGVNGFRLAEGWEAVPDIDAVSLYATFSNVRETNAEVLARWYADITKRMHARGKAVMLPVHPGLDSRAIQLDEVEGPEGVHWTIQRRDGATFRAYLEAARQSGADFISVTSFNEWPETTNIEPALTWADPYAYLKILATFQGRAWETPPLPPVQHLDPLIQAHRKDGR
jgi:hypothetical protein